MKIVVYKGKIGNEDYLTELGDSKDYLIPHKKDLISLGNRDKNIDEVYKVIGVLYDYAKSNESQPEINIFVEEYDWE